MKKLNKTFPNIKNIIFLLTFLGICCGTASKNNIETEEFINVYAHLLIIRELKIDSLKKDSLATNVLNKNRISMAQINRTISEYKQAPEEWVVTLQKIRDRIRYLKSDAEFLESGYSGAVDKRND